MKYVFGPVPSRRLGKSLGIDPIPLKTCNWNCVYCQLGRTRRLIQERGEYIPPQTILEELQDSLAVYKPGEIDWVTIVGSGEPTLYRELGWLIQQVKMITQLPVAVITNGSLLSLPGVRRDLAAVDAVLPTLDAGSELLYRKINRPWSKLTFASHVQGLVDFRKEFSGQLWVEIMLLKNMNDTVKALEEIANVLKLIHPDQVHLMLPVRPPAESWVQPTDEIGVQKAMSILGSVARVLRPERQGTVTCNNGDLESAILGIITRHPMSEDELIANLGHHSPGEVKHTLIQMHKDHKVQQVVRYGKQFWNAAGANFAAGER